MFPLLQLPLLCIQEVTDQWEFWDLYNFSILSKRAKGISKRKKGSNLKVELDLSHRSLKIVGGFSFYFHRDRFLDDWKKRGSMDPNVSSFIQETQHFMDVFNCPFERMDMHLDYYLEDDQLIMMIDWMNGMKTEIKEIVIQSATWSMLKIFMNRFKKSIERLFFDKVTYSHQYVISIHKRLNFEIKDLLLSRYSQWIHLDLFLSMDTERMRVDRSRLSGEDLNVFLRSWQEGKTNRKLKYLEMETCWKCDVKDVLKDCGGEIMDPRTINLKFREHGNRDVWIRGGIHIRRNDGRLAVISSSGYKYYEEKEETHRRQIQDYEIAQEIWNSENSPVKWFAKFYFIYIF
uniref:FBA_2 domain-containing protein n=1 Tax=Caenorhabditis tropicalis TaxID=1561998 RepID=A0A1I7U1B6_9PELO